MRLPNHDLTRVIAALIMALLITETAHAQEWPARWQWRNVDLLPATVVVESESCVLLRSISDSTWLLIRIADLDNEPWPSARMTFPDSLFIRQVADANGDGHQDLVVDAGTTVNLILGPLSDSSSVIPIPRRPLYSSRPWAKLEQTFDFDHDGTGDHVELYKSSDQMVAYITYGDRDQPFADRTAIRVNGQLKLSTSTIWIAMIDGVNCLLQYGLIGSPRAEPFALHIYPLVAADLARRPDSLRLVRPATTIDFAEPLDLSGTFQSTDALRAFHSSGDVVRISPEEIRREQAHWSWSEEGYRTVIEGLFWEGWQTTVPIATAGRMMVRAECVDEGGGDRPLRLSALKVADAPGLPLQQLGTLRIHPAQCVPDPHGSETIRRFVVLPDLDGDGMDDLMISYGPVNDSTQVVTAVYASSDRALTHVTDQTTSPAPSLPCAHHADRVAVYSALGQQVATIRVTVTGTLALEELSDLPQMPLWAVSDGCAVRIR